MTTMFSLLLLAAGTAQNSGFRELTAVVSGNYERRTFVSDSQNLTAATLVAHARKIQAANTSRRWIAHYFGTDEKFVRRYPTKGVNHSSLESWRFRLQKLFDEGFEPPETFGEVNVVGGVAVVRLRKDGNAFRKVLGDIDPLIYRRANVGVECEVLEFFGNVTTRAGVGVNSVECQNCVDELHVCARCSAEPNEEIATWLARRLLDLLPPKLGGFLYLRSDDFFFDIPEFPMLYAFRPRTAPISPKSEKSTMFVPLKPLAQ